MPGGPGARRRGTIRRAGLLALALCLDGGGGLSAERRVLAHAADFPAVAAPDTAVSSDTGVDLTPAAHGVLVRPGDPLNEALAGLGARLDQLARLVARVQAGRDEVAALKEQNRQLLARIAVLEAEWDRLPNALKLARELSKASDAARAKVRELLEALIAERRRNAELGADLAVAKAERAKVEQAAAAKEAALAAWIDGLHDELAEREAQLAEAGAARAQNEARLEAQARAAQAERARAGRQLAALQDQLRERDRELASARAESEDLRERLLAVETDLGRQAVDSGQLAAELAAPRRAADFTTVMAADNVTAIQDQIGVLRDAAGDAPPRSPDQPAGLLAATLAGVPPAMPYPKPRPEAGRLDAWAAIADMAHGEAPAGPTAVIEDDTWIQASLRETAGGASESGTDRARFVAADSPGAGEVISTAALLTNPSGPGRVGENGGDPSTALLDWGDRLGLSEAAARLADGLRATREEAMFQGEEQVLTVDVERRTFAVNRLAAPVLLDPALDIRLLTARSELAGDGKGGIRFYPDGSSTGGRIELELLGERAAVSVVWSTGAVAVER